MLSQHYLLFKMMHISGVIIFLGNIIITGFWKFLADLSHDWRIIAFSQRLVTYTDIIFTFLGVLIIAITGIQLSGNYGGYWDVPWIFWGLMFFIASGVIWILLLIPLQIKLHCIANTFNGSKPIPREYWFYETIWMIFGILATILPFITLYFMVFKPS